MRRRASTLLAALLAAAPAAAQPAPDAVPAPDAPPAPAAPPPSAAPSAIAGVVTDAETGTPLPNAVVEIVAGGGGETTTDARGRFRLSVPPGRYELRVRFPLYQIRRLRRIELEPGETVGIELALRPAPDAFEEIKIEVDPERRSEAGLLLARRRSASMSDGVSAQEMSRGGDSSASEAVKRVVSATVEDGRYVLIRGLGDRYVTALINGAPLPSPEPDRQAIPLDLFPASLLASLTIDKSYAPWNPGAFGGGTVQVETTSYPRDLTMAFKLGGGIDSGATGKERLTYDGGDLDLLGFDDGTRALPASVPGDRPARISDTLDRTTMEEIGESFRNTWTLAEERAAPALSFGATIGDTVRPGGVELGYVTALSFGRSLDVKDARIHRLQRSEDRLQVRESMTARTGSEAAGLGALAALGLRPHRDHDVDAVLLYAHAGEVTAQRVSGFSESDALPVETTRLGFTARQLGFAQIGTRHRLPAGLRLRLQGNAGHTRRDEPDTRDLAYNLTADGRARYKNDAGSGQRFYGALAELTLGGSADLEAPLGDRLSLRGGGSAQTWSREMSARRFGYAFVGQDPATLYLPPGQLFADDRIGPDFRLEERTLQPDRYQADLTVLAGYAALEVRPTGPLRVLVGARYEHGAQSLRTGSPFALGEPDPDDSVDRAEGHALPAVAATLALGESMNLRAAWSYTLARPMFRELAPFQYFDYERRQSVSGNPALAVTRIHNADLRWEMFGGDADLLAAGVFYKRFRDPIEEVVVSAAGGDTSFANAERASSMGAELEARVSLARLSDALAGFRASGNLTLVRSRVTIGMEDLGAQTSATRALQGQSPYVVNLGLGWKGAATEVTALYNVVGARIVEVGFQNLPDTYERPLHRVDLGVSQRLGPTTRLGLTGKNLLLQKVRLTGGDFEVYRYDPGLTVSASLEWTP